jgi:hypothetical protein
MSPFDNASLFTAPSLPVIFDIIFLLVFAFVAVTSAALYYHWMRYGVGVVAVFQVFFIYTFGALVFLGSMYAALQGI